MANETEMYQAPTAESFGAKMAARKRAAKGDKEKAAVSNGIGESKVFGGTHERQLADGERDWSLLTLNGMPIPLDVQGHLPYYYTDQAVAERAARPQPAVEFTRHEEDKKMFDKYEDGLRASVEPWEAGVDPLLEVKKANIEAGQRYRYLSATKIDRDGWRGWEPVKKVIGGIEQVVKLGTMILGKMSEDRAVKRDKFFQGKAKEQMVNAQEQVAELRDRVISDRDMKNIKRRRRVDEHEGFETVYGDEQETDDQDFDSMRARDLSSGFKKS